MIRYYLSPLVWAAIILLLSSLPSKSLPELTFWEWLGVDKIAHVILYAVLVFQVMRSCIRQYANWNLRYHAKRVAIVTSMVYGGLIELYQEYILTDRNGDWFDMIANLAGAFLGVWLFRLVFFQYIR